MNGSYDTQDGTGDCLHVMDVTKVYEVALHAFLLV